MLSLLLYGCIRQSVGYICFMLSVGKQVCLSVCMSVYRPVCVTRNVIPCLFVGFIIISRQLGLHIFYLSVRQCVCQFVWEYCFSLFICFIRLRWIYLSVCPYVVYQCGLWVVCPFIRMFYHEKKSRYIFVLNMINICPSRDVNSFISCFSKLTYFFADCYSPRWLSKKSW